jgi:hypothetical protein
MFAGRLDEIEALEQSLVQTRAGQPKHFMLTGERGIGKTSLLNYLRWLAKGDIKVFDNKFQFLVLDLDIEKGSTPIALARKIERALRHELGKSEPARNFLSTTWKVFLRVEAAGISLREGVPQSQEAEDVLDELAYSLSNTLERVCESGSDPSIFGARYEGVLLCIDEADSASKQLHLGSLLKSLTERLEKRGCDRLMIGLAGLTDLRDVLRESHPSSLRIFDEIQLRRLSSEDSSRVIDMCLEEANEKNSFQTTITTEARNFLVSVSEGYPHFIQQFGYSAFAEDSDGLIDIDDATNGALGKTSERGALKLIGDRYYRDDFYNKIQQDSYRQVLRVMSKRRDGWISKEEIRAEFKGDDGTLSNAIKALRDRHIILSKEGARGVYRLQNRGFALWIKLYTQEDPRKLFPFEPEGSGEGA